MNLDRLIFGLSASAVICLLLVEPSLAGCEGVTYTHPTIAGYDPPDFVINHYRDEAIAKCEARRARAEERWREIKALRDYPMKGADMGTVLDLKKALDNGHDANAERYEKTLEEEAQRRKNMGWDVPASPSVPSAYNPPGGDPNGVRLGVAPKGTKSDLSDLKSRVLELKSPGH